MLKALATAFAALMISHAAFAAPELGNAAPEFTVTASNGATISIAQMKDDIVVLEWSNPECPFVKKFYESGTMQGLQNRYTKQGVKWIRIVSSAPGKQGHMDAEAANKWITEHDIAASATLLDESGEIGRLYDAKTTPHMFIINKGVLTYMGAIDSIRSPYPQDIEKAEAYVANQLDALLTGKKVEPQSTQPYGCGVKY